jgi:hypothetical protein
MTITNSLARSSCTKCVEVLQELVSGLQQDNDNNNKTNNNNSKNKKNEPPPLTLLKAIARSSHQQRNEYDQWGQQRSNHNQHNSHRQRQQQQQQQQQQHQHQQFTATSSSSSSQKHKPKSEQLKIEEIENGIRLIIPVETTAPTLMKRWTQLIQEEEEEEGELEELEEENVMDDILVDGTTALATSIRIKNDSNSNNNNNVVNNYDDENENENDTTTNSSPLNDNIHEQQQQRKIQNPLIVELHCRKCLSKGPEAGARAFLMGPEPLSIVLCHNRINSDVDEIEEILTHELIHLYDVQTLQLDLTDCETVAYSEVRAAREAECSKYITNHRQRQNQQKQQNQDQNQQESSNGILLPSIITESWSKAQHSYCVKNIALGAIQNMFPQRGVGKQCLNKVWDKAYTDHRPFNTKSKSSRPTQKQHQRQRQRQQQNNDDVREEREETSYSTNTNYYKSSSGTTKSHGNVASGK